MGPKPTNDPRALLVWLMERDRRSMESVSKHLGRNKAYVHQYLTRFKPKRLDELDRAKLAGLFRDVLPDEFINPEDRSVNHSLTTVTGTLPGGGGPETGRDAVDLEMLRAFVLAIDKRVSALEAQSKEGRRPQRGPKREES